MENTWSPTVHLRKNMGLYLGVNFMYVLVVRWLGHRTVSICEKAFGFRITLEYLVEFFFFSRNRPDVVFWAIKGRVLVLNSSTEPSFIQRNSCLLKPLIKIILAQHEALIVREYYSAECDSEIWIKIGVLVENSNWKFPNDGCLSFVNSNRVSPTPLLTCAISILCD